MTFPKLTLPPKDYSEQQFCADRERRGSFASWFYSAIIQYQGDNKFYYGTYEDDSDAAKKRKVCESINKYYNDMRGYIAQTMQQNILDHDGVIDSWPDSANSKISVVEGSRFAFDYFGDDYTISKSGEAVRKSRELVYRNEYHYHDTEAYKEAERQKDHLKNEFQKAKQAGDAGGVSFLCLLGLIYLLVQMVLIVGELLCHLGTFIFDPLYRLNDAVALLANIPYVIYLFITVVFADTKKGEIFCIVILLGACLFGFMFLLSYYQTCRKNARERKRTKRALNALINSAEYKQIVAENNELRRLNEDMAEQWHRAWFNWVCSIKYAAKEPVDRAAEKRFSDELKKKVARADFNELIRQEKNKT